jgi:Outer membrane protein transport protein (OMPP1/FadL/TodX).
MKRILIIILSLMASSSFAQTASDAIQYSQSIYQGTAKSMALGNAVGAIGSDFTAISINPAGMGLYRSHEMTMTMGYLQNSTKSLYFGKSNFADKSNLTINNIGYVKAEQYSKYRKLRYLQYGFGFNRNNDFNSYSNAIGFNPNNSMIDSYLAQLNVTSYNQIENKFPYTIFPAWETYLIDTTSQNGQLGYTSPVPKGNLDQQDIIRVNGRSEDWTFAMSANFLDKFFIGGSLGATHIKRNVSRTYSEADIELSNDFRDWSFTENTATNGWGINFKVGLIAYPVKWLRIGASYHTPTLFSFEEIWETITEANIGNYYKYSTEPSFYTFNMTSPMRTIGSIAIIIGQGGMISADYEYVDYRKTVLSSNDYDYSSINNEIKAQYGSSSNIRIGTEWIVRNLYLRGGFAFYDSPCRLNIKDGRLTQYSCGIGLPIGAESRFDIAYVMTYGQKQYYPYSYYENDVLATEPINQKSFRSNLAATLKLRF